MDLNKIYVQHSSLSGIAQSLQTVVSNIKSMESAMDYLTAVSYTHLDVYKRQVIETMQYAVWIWEIS